MCHKRPQQPVVGTRCVGTSTSTEPSTSNTTVWLSMQQLQAHLVIRLRLIFIDLEWAKRCGSEPRLLRGTLGRLLERIETNRLSCWCSCEAKMA